MNLFDVYPLFDVNIVKGKGCHVWDDKGQEYLDLYGGHAVISVGHLAGWVSTAIPWSTSCRWNWRSVWARLAVMRTISSF